MKVQGSNDVLSMAINKPEYSGRVRGVGGYVTPTQYFGIPTQSSRAIQLQLQQWFLQQQKMWEAQNRQMHEFYLAKIQELQSGQKVNMNDQRPNIFSPPQPFVPFPP